MNDQENRAQLVLYWWHRATESLESAKRELAAGSYTFATNRLYYCAFYAVSAVLHEHGQAFRKHSGVRAASHQVTIKPGLLDSQWGKFYDQLFEDRNEADYIALIAFDKEYIENRLTQCKQFLEQLRPLLSSL